MKDGFNKREELTKKKHRFRQNVRPESRKLYNQHLEILFRHLGIVLVNGEQLDSLIDQ